MTAMKKYLRLARTDILYMLVWQMGFYLFGMAMVLIINRFVNDDPDYACMGSFFALLGTVVGLMVRGNNTGHVRLRLAVTMGMTRRSFLVCEPLITAVDVALALVFARVLYGLELALYQWLYPDFENQIALDVFFRWQVLVIVGICAVVASLFFTMLLQRGGMKGFGVLWLVLCAACMVLPQAVSAYRDGAGSILAAIGGWIYHVVAAVPPAAWGAVGAAVVLAMAVASVLGLRRVEVRM